jgi:hypothetical protein
MQVVAVEARSKAAHAEQAAQVVAVMQAQRVATMSELLEQ